jgi:ABC-2 type transport system permease protein/lipopolysaccharide transport system permease protein
MANVMTDLPGGTNLLRGFYVPLVIRTVRNLRTCLQWAWLDIVCHYRRSRIGPLWETINILVMVLGLTVVSSAVIGGDVTDLISYIGLGIIIWTAISTLITEGTTMFVRNAGLITSSNVSIDCYIGRSVLRTLIVFCHHIVLYFLGLALLLVPLSWTSLLALPGIALLFINGYWVGVVLAFLCARFRDLEQIIRNLLQLAFFMTPVFWKADLVASSKRAIVDYNVLFYFIEIIRAPLLGQVPPLKYYAVALGSTIIGYLIAVLVYQRMRRRLAFFVA